MDDLYDNFLETQRDWSAIVHQEMLFIKEVNDLMPHPKKLMPCLWSEELLVTAGHTFTDQSSGPADGSSVV